MKKQNTRIISALLFVVFSAILFLNNSTQLLSNLFNLNYFQINTIAWVGLIGSVIYTIYNVGGNVI